MGYLNLQFVDGVCDEVGSVPAAEGDVRWRDDEPGEDARAASEPVRSHRAEPLQRRGARRDHRAHGCARRLLGVRGTRRSSWRRRQPEPRARPSASISGCGRSSRRAGSQSRRRGSRRRPKRGRRAATARRPRGSCCALEIDENGLGPVHHRILAILRRHGRPLALRRLVAQAGITVEAFRSIYEPALVAARVINATPRGMMLAPR